MYGRLLRRFSVLMKECKQSTPVRIRKGDFISTQPHKPALKNTPNLSPLVKRITDAMQGINSVLSDNILNNYPPELKKTINLPRVKKIAKAEEATCKSLVSEGYELLKEHKIIEARKAFKKIITQLEKTKPKQIFPIDKQLLSRAYTGHGLAYMVDSPLHWKQVLADFNKAITISPQYALPKQKKAEYEFELGLTARRKLVP